MKYTRSILLSLALVGSASAQTIINPNNGVTSGVAYSGSGVSPVSTAISAAGASASFTPLAGRLANIQLTGTASANCYLERQIDGATWQPISATASGSTTYLYQYNYSGISTSEQFIESQTNVSYRLDCGAQLGSFASGALTVRFSQ
jgi:hypothetical protein